MHRSVKKQKQKDGFAGLFARSEATERKEKMEKQETYKRELQKQIEEIKQRKLEERRRLDGIPPFTFPS